MASFCKAIDHHVSINSQGLVRPCCWFKGGTNSDISEARSNFKKEIKSIDHPGCIRCKNSELIGVKSRRIFYEESWPASSGLNYLDISFANTCNLECLMCNSSNSSKLYKRDIELKGNDFPVSAHKHATMDFNRIKELAEICNSSIGEFLIDVKGGEPMVTPEFVLFLSMLDIEFKKRCTLKIITNGTRIMKELPSNFKKVKYLFSIEALGQLYQYIRGGKEFTSDQMFDIIEMIKTENIKNFQDASYNFSITVMSYNLFNLVELDNEIADRGFWPPTYNTILVNPDFLSFGILPQQLSNMMIEKLKEEDVKFKPVITALKNMEKLDNNKVEMFIRYTRMMEKRNKMPPIEEIVPEFRTML